MGTPLPANAPGLVCTACFGVGKAFGDVPTPLVVQARLTRILPGEFWQDADEQLLLTTHWLEQTAAPCIYRINDGTFTWILQWFGGFTEFAVLRNGDNKLAFSHVQDQGCGLDLDNEITAPANAVAYNGFANFNWDLAGL